MNRKKFTPPVPKVSDAGMLITAPGRDPMAILIPISSIVPGSNPRMDLGDISELKASIAQDGLLYPLLVCRKEDNFELLGGYRRIECLRQLAWEAVPCRVIEAAMPEVIKLLDNLLRQQLDPYSEFKAIQSLLPAFENNQSALARALSKSPSYVNRAVRAAKMMDENASLCAGAQVPLSKSAIMELADSANPSAVLAASEDARKDSIRKARGKEPNHLKSDQQGSSQIPENRSEMRFTPREHGWRLEIFWCEKTAIEPFRSEVIAQLTAIIKSIGETIDTTRN